MRVLKRLKLSLSRFAENANGVAAVEFAFVGGMMLAVTATVVQVGLLAMAQAELDNATTAASRQVQTLSAATNYDTPEKFKALLCASGGTILNCDSIFFEVFPVPVQTDQTSNLVSPPITFDASGHVSNQFRFDVSEKGQPVVVRVMYLFPLFIGPLGKLLDNVSNGSHLLASTTIFTSEN